MKKLLLAINVLVLSIMAFPQPILNSVNTNPVIGDQFLMIPGSWISEVGSGANQVWNFASITMTTSSAVSYTAQTVSSGNAAVFPNANVQMSSSAETGFLKTSSTAIENYGTATGTVQINYSDPEDQMRYPCSMGTAYTDTYTATYTTGGNNCIRTGTISVTADAYGTLQLPGSTYSNVLRVHMVQQYTDSYIPSGTVKSNYYNNQYLWYLPNNHRPIFSTYSIPTVAMPWTGSTTLQSITNSIGELQAGLKSMNLYPNPANGDFINMDLNLEKNIGYEVVIMDNLGREVLKTETISGLEGYNFRSIDISGLESGLYQVSLKSEGQLLKTTKIVIAR